MSPENAADYIERHYGGGTPIEKALIDLVCELRTRLERQERASAELMGPKMLERLARQIPTLKEAAGDAAAGERFACAAVASELAAMVRDGRHTVALDSYPAYADACDTIAERIRQRGRGEPGELRDELRNALEESVKLQAHYAQQLNMRDGGQRRVFANADEWLERLRETRLMK